MTPLPTALPPASDWQPIFDPSSQLYYWWNIKTNETTWENPTEPSLKRKREESGHTSGEPKLGADVEDNDTVESDEDVSSASDHNNELEAGRTSEKNRPAQPVTGTSSEQQTNEGAKSSQEIVAGDQPKTSTDKDYYNSQEYYDWYYSQCNGQKAAGGQSIQPTPAELSAYPPSSGDNLGEGDYGSNTGVVGRIDYSNYAVTGAFSTRTGRFQNVDRDPRFAAPDQYFDQTSKAFRQMNFYFDYDKYQEERAAQRMAELNGEGKPRKQVKLTKKELEFYKQRKKEKKLSSLKQRFGGD